MNPEAVGDHLTTGRLVSDGLLKIISDIHFLLSIQFVPFSLACQPLVHIIADIYLNVLKSCFKWMHSQ